jgi:hypothetical protein
MHAIDNGLAYCGRAVSWVSEVFMKLTTGLAWRYKLALKNCADKRSSLSPPPFSEEDKSFISSNSKLPFLNVSKVFFF